MVYIQYREIRAGGFSATDLDMDIRVRMTREDGLRFEASIWNIKESTWAKVKKGDNARILLGWEDGQTQNVAFGTVKDKSTTQERNDVKFTLKGVDETDEQTKARFSKTWNNRQPNAIASSIASNIGLTVGKMSSTGQPIEGYWSISKDRPVRHWLDQLVKEAEKLTGVEWEWYTQAGKLFFVKKSDTTQQAVVLAYENTLVNIGEAESSGARKSDAPNKSSGELEFEALCEPSLQKGSLVSVQTDEHSGVYKLTDYEFQSITMSGKHNVRGTLVPESNAYVIQGPRGSLGEPRVV